MSSDGLFLASHVHLHIKTGLVTVGADATVYFLFQEPDICKQNLDIYSYLYICSRDRLCFYAGIRFIFAKCNYYFFRLGCGKIHNSVVARSK